MATRARRGEAGLEWKRNGQGEGRGKGEANNKSIRPIKHDTSHSCGTQSLAVLILHDGIYQVARESPKMSTGRMIIRDQGVE